MVWTMEGYLFKSCILIASPASTVHYGAFALWRIFPHIKATDGLLVKAPRVHRSPSYDILRPVSAHTLCTAAPGIMSDNRFACDYAKRSTSSCKKCKQKLEKEELRIAKVVPNFFHDGDGEMKQYYHAKCIFETFVRARASTKIIETPDDIEGFSELKQADKDNVKKLIKDVLEKKGSPKKATPKKTQTKLTIASPTVKKRDPNDEPSTSRDPPTPPPPVASDDVSEKDNSFRQFRRLCAEIAEENSYIGKTKLVSNYIKKGNSGTGFKGDVYLTLKLLLPGVVKIVYNLNSKQLVKVFSQIFGADLEAMTEDLEQGDVAETIKTFFDPNKRIPPQKKSVLSIQVVDALLEELSQYSKEDDQQRVLTRITKRCTANDLKMVIRLIKHDLRINAGAKHIYVWNSLDGLDKNAYDAFKASRDLNDVVARVQALNDETNQTSQLSKTLSVKASLMTAVQPMLAEACKSVDFAFKRFPGGMFSEIKYDGERVQVHKRGSEFQYFSRSLKAVQAHKVQHFRDYLPKAFPHGNDLILDSEVLLIDTTTGQPLPFGSLGVHKKKAFKDATVCLFIFDCILYNGETLMDKPLKERRDVLMKNMTEIPNHIMFSEMNQITRKADLEKMMMKVFRQGLEGLVLKDVNGVYEPGKRHWLKVKKDYLAEGAMADSADLVVLGAYYGTGNKGGIMSIFLMGVHDPNTNKWCTVTKCHSGFDDKTLEKLQDLDMVKISKDYTRVPSWLNVNRGLVPDFVAADPKASPVWEITGAEFTKAEIHTAGGVSIRFPRCTKMRDDKSWKEATNYPRLMELYKTSKQFSDIPDLRGGGKMDADSCEETDQPHTSPVKRSADNDHRPCKKAKTNTQHLPDVFTGMIFHVPDDVHNATELKRFVIAYDGDVADEYDVASATHVVVSSVKMMCEEGDGRGVTADWLWRCIKKKRLLPR